MRLFFQILLFLISPILFMYYTSEAYERKREGGWKREINEYEEEREGEQTVYGGERDFVYTMLYAKLTHTECRVENCWLSEFSTLDRVPLTQEVNKERKIEIERDRERQEEIESEKHMEREGDTAKKR